MRVPRSDRRNAPAPSSALPPVGTVTLLFSDIEGSSQLEQRLGTSTYARLRGRHRALLRAAFAAHGGFEGGTEGDSFFVVFPGVRPAVLAAIEAQRALEGADWPDGGRIRVRIGIHTGDVLLVDDDYVGIDINRAARIMSAGHGGQILASEESIRHAGGAGDGIDFRDLGVHRLKDFDPIRLYQVVADGLAADFPALRTLPAPFGGLPAQPTSFVGRGREIAEVRRRLADTRLLTLTGPGGTGKTRLAIAAAQASLADFRDGAAWVGLSSLSDPELVPAAVATALGVVDEGTRDLADGIVARIGSAQLLLVIDNFEQVVSASPLVADLLGRCPEVRALATSRAVLHLAGELEYPVPPLGVPDPTGPLDQATVSGSEAVALFVQRARAVRPEFALTAETTPLVVAICARLDGLPLAIELAAARLRILGPAALLDRLSSALGLLTGGARDLPARQQTLRGAIAWSYDLLEPGERSLFERLSVFAGGWTLEAAEAVVDPDRSLGVDILDGLESLADKSLVRPGETDDGEPHFRMLQVIREFGAERLAASAEDRATRDRHLAFFAELARVAEPELVGRAAGAWLDRLELEHDNIRAALRWALEAGQVETGLTMAGRLWRFWHQRGHLGEGLAMTRELLACPDGTAPTPGRAKALNGAGGLAYWENDFPTAQAYYEEHLDLVRRLDDRAGMSEALLNLGFMAAIPRDFDAAIGYYTESAELARSLGDRSVEVAAMSGLGLIYSLSGDLERARDTVEHSLVLADEIGDRFRSASSRGVLARIHLAAGRLEDARRTAARSLALFGEVRDTSGVAMELWDMAEVAIREDRPTRALVLAGATMAVRQRLEGGAPTALTQTLDVERLARERLDPAAADAAWEVGSRLPLEVAVAFGVGDDELPASAAPASPTSASPRAGSEGSGAVVG